MLKLYKSIADNSGGPSVERQSFGATFNISDWVEDGNNFYINFQHNLNTFSVIIQVYDMSNNNVTSITTQIVDKNNVKIISTEKFAGRITIIGG